MMKLMHHYLIPCGKKLEFLDYQDTAQLVVIEHQCTTHLPLESVQVLVDVMQDLEKAI
jgi:hypothetical protein